jgi:hypothetical protein
MHACREDYDNINDKSHDPVWGLDVYHNHPVNNEDTRQKQTPLYDSSELQSSAGDPGDQDSLMSSHRLGRELTKKA